MITLVKTTGGSSGTPKKCHCGSVDFVRSGIAWHCGNCGSYVPAKLEKGNPFQALQMNLQALTDHHKKLREMLTELEELVGKR